MRFPTTPLLLAALGAGSFPGTSFALSQSSGSALGSGPALTEFLSRNDDGIEDEDGDREDWIEIHNVPGAGAVDLGGWALTDDAGPRRWTGATIFWTRSPLSDRKTG